MRRIQRLVVRLSRAGSAGIAAAVFAVVLSLSLALGSPVHAATRGATAQACGSTNLAPFTATPSAASITLSRTQGPPGMSLVVSGSGFPAGAPLLLDVDFAQTDGTLVPLMSAGVRPTVGPDGSFQTSPFPLPYEPGCGPAPSTKIVFVAHTSDDAVSATAPFVYTPAPTLQSDSQEQVKPNFAVTLSGQNWEPNEQVTITSGILATPILSCPPTVPPICDTPASPAPAATIQVTADAQGNLSFSYALPGGLPPRTGVLVRATGTGPRYGTIEATPIEFLIRPSDDPTIALSRTEGEAGVAVVVRGDHWYPGDPVTIEYCRGQNTSIAPGEPRCLGNTTQWLGQTTVDAAGRLNATVSLPTNARTGPVLIQARVENDVLGLAVYAQAAPFEIVPQPLPWSQQHPRAALALTLARPAAPALALGLLLLAAHLWSRRRSRRTRPGAHAADPSSEPASRQS